MANGAPPIKDWSCVVYDKDVVLSTPGALQNLLANSHASLPVKSSSPYDYYLLCLNWDKDLSDRQRQSQIYTWMGKSGSKKLPPQISHAGKCLRFPQNYKGLGEQDTRKLTSCWKYAMRMISIQRKDFESNLVNSFTNTYKVIQNMEIFPAEYLVYVFEHFFNPNSLAEVEAQPSICKKIMKAAAFFTNGLYEILYTLWVKGPQDKTFRESLGLEPSEYQELVQKNQLLEKPKDGGRVTVAHKSAVAQEVLPLIVKNFRGGKKWKQFFNKIKNDCLDSSGYCLARTVYSINNFPFNISKRPKQPKIPPAVSSESTVEMVIKYDPLGTHGPITDLNEDTVFKLVHSKMKVQDFAVAMEDQGHTFPVIFGDLPYFVTNYDFDDVINCSKFPPDDPGKYQLNFVQEFATSYIKLAAQNSVGIFFCSNWQASAIKTILEMPREGETKSAFYVEELFFQRGITAPSLHGYKTTPVNELDFGVCIIRGDPSAWVTFNYETDEGKTLERKYVGCFWSKKQTGWTTSSPNPEEPFQKPEKLIHELFQMYGKGKPAPILELFSGSCMTLSTAFAYRRSAYFVDFHTNFSGDYFINKVLQILTLGQFPCES